MTSAAVIRNLSMRKSLNFLFHLWPEALIILFSFPVGFFSGIGTYEIIKLTILLMGQNATFTLVSRARQMANTRLHMFAAVGSNGFYIFVFSTLVAHYDSSWLKFWYIVCTAVGSVHMHHIALNKIEKTKMFKKDSLVPRSEFDQAVSDLKGEINTLRRVISGDANA
ncbi:MAG TPA: hypothetical protein VJC12_02580 [Candidatus Paceibacterota bacterium]